MPDSITFDMDTAPLEAKLNALGDVAQPFINDASEATAMACAAGALTRLERQLGPDATGKTAAGITARPAYDGNGWVFLVERDDMPNLPLWIEKGTHAGQPHSHDSAARPFFYITVDLEVPDHERRLELAFDQAIAAAGLSE